MITLIPDIGEGLYVGRGKESISSTVTRITPIFTLATSAEEAYAKKETK